VPVLERPTAVDIGLGVDREDPERTFNSCIVSLGSGLKQGFF